MDRRFYYSYQQWWQPLLAQHQNQEPTVKAVKVRRSSHLYNVRENNFLMHDKVNINEFLINEERSREQSKHVSSYTHTNTHINSKKNARYLNVCFF